MWAIALVLAFLSFIFSSLTMLGTVIIVVIFGAAAFALMLTLAWALAAFASAAITAIWFAEAWYFVAFIASIAYAIMVAVFLVRVENTGAVICIAANAIFVFVAFGVAEL